MTTRSFPFVDAIYRHEPNPAYTGNPYIEALPALPDDLTLAKALTNLPKFDPEERSLDGPSRIQRLDTLRQVHIALPRVVRLARAMLKLMVTGYGPRRPYSAADNKTVRELYALQQSGNFVSVRETGLAAQHSMALIGASGCGKSFSLRHIAGLFPPAIYHEEIGKWQLPFLFIEMAYDGESVHTLASELFAEFDRLLPDGRYTELYMERKGLNAQQRLAKALAIAHELGVGEIVVDESQNERSIGNEPKHSRRGTSSVRPLKRETPLTKLLITASNTSHIPMVFSGTLEMKNMVGARFTRARRMAGRGSSVWSTLPRHAEEPAKKGEFEILLRALFRYQWIRKPLEFSQQWVDVFHGHTQGIPDIIVKLYESSQETAIANGIETLTPELVAGVFAKEFVMTEFGIKALRDRDDTLREAVPDLYQLDPSERDEPRTPDAHFAAPQASQSKERSGETTKARAPKPPLPSPEPVPIGADALEAADLRGQLHDAKTGVTATVGWDDLKELFSQ